MRKNRKLKDSLFTSLFGRKEYAVQLVKALHPEKTEITEDDIEIITIENVFTRGMYNDLGLMLKDRLIILAEAQSTWNENMAVRSFLYLAETYKRHLNKHEINLFTSDSVNLPRPEVYVIFTGERKHKPEYLYLSNHFESKQGAAVELKVKMIYNSREGDIIYQYINFCRVFDSEHRLNPDDDRTAVRNTFRICSDKNLLKKYLEEHEVELNDIMYDYLFNEKYWRKLAIRDETERLKKEARETGYAEGHEAGIAEGLEAGIAEGREEGRIEGINAAKKETAANMIKFKVCTLEQISKITGFSLEEIRELAVELEKN